VDLRQLSGGQRVAPGQVLGRVSGQDPEQEEVEDQYEQQGEKRAADLHQQAAQQPGWPGAGPLVALFRGPAGPGLPYRHRAPPPGGVSTGRYSRSSAVAVLRRRDEISQPPPSSTTAAISTPIRIPLVPDPPPLEDEAAGAAVSPVMCWQPMLWLVSDGLVPTGRMQR